MTIPADAARTLDAPIVGEIERTLAMMTDRLNSPVAVLTHEKPRRHRVYVESLGYQNQPPALPPAQFARFLWGFCWGAAAMAYSEQPATLVRENARLRASIDRLLDRLLILTGENLQYWEITRDEDRISK